MRFSTLFSTLAVVLLVGVNGLHFQLSKSFNPMGIANSLTKRAGTISSSFNYDAPHFSYYVDALIGSAHSFLRLRLSSEPFTWVPGPLPSKNYCAPATKANIPLCIQSNWSGIFDPASSTSFTNLSDSLNLTASDARYYVLGYYGKDTIQIGQTPITEVPLGVAWNYTRTPELGLGLNGGTEKSLLETMHDQKAIDVIAYGLYLNDYDANSSELTIGAIDTAKYNGNLVTFKSSQTTNVQLNSILFGNPGEMTELATGLNANIEFSTGLMYFQTGVFQAIVSSVNGYLDNVYGSYLCDCSYRYSGPQFLFQFPGMNITVDASQYIIPAIAQDGSQASLKNGNPACVVLVDTLTDYSIDENLGYTAVLGMPFARCAYIVHDFTNEQTSFAQAILNNTSNTIQKLNTDGVAPFATVVPTSSVSPSAVGATGTATGGATSGQSGGGAKSSSHIGPTVGGVGGVILILIAIGAFLLYRRRQKKKANTLPAPPPMEQYPNQQGYALPQYGQQQQQSYGTNGQPYAQPNPYQEQYGTTVPPNKGFVGQQPQSPGPNAGLSPGGYGQQGSMSPASEMPGSPISNQRTSSYGGYVLNSPSHNVAPHQHIENAAMQPAPVELPHSAPVELPSHR